MHSVETERHGGDGHQDARHDGQQADGDVAPGSVNTEQQGENAQAANQRQALDLRPDGAACVHGKHRRARHAKLQRAVGVQGVEALANDGQRTFLRVGVGAFGACHGHQQRALSVRRRPRTIGARRCAASCHAFKRGPQLAGGIAREERLEQQAGRSRQLDQCLADGIVQPLAAEALGIDFGTEHVAIAQEKRLIHFATRGVAVDHAGEFCAFPQGRRQLGRRLGARGRCATVDPEQDHAGKGAILDLIDQQALSRIGLARQKGRHVGAVAACGDHGQAKRHQDQPPAENESCRMTARRVGARTGGQQNGRSARAVFISRPRSA